jgi:hypothetical protein
MLVYQTKNFLKKLSELQHLKEDIEKFISRIVPLPFHEAISRLDKHHPYVKHRIGKSRVIAKALPASENIKNPVLVLLDIIQRGDRDYENFNHDAESYGTSYYEPLIEKEMDDIINLANTATIEQEPELPSELQLWLFQSSRFDDKSEILIYESENWYNKTLSTDFNISRFYDIVFAILNKNLNEIEINKIDNLSIATSRKNPNFNVIFTDIIVHGFNPNAIFEVYFLIDALWNGKPDENYVENISKKFSSLKSTTNLETLAQLSYRAYPDFILVDEEIWKEIEKDKQSNLALSSEEETILKKVTEPQKPELPIFINGRAGSGKSTLLYYLFANFLRRKFEENLNYEPLFLTYNEALLETAKSNIFKILKSNYSYRPKSLQVNQDEIEKYFKTFHQILIENLPEDARESFRNENRITIYKFKTLWKQNKNFLPKDISPELSWFAIRAFIKGYSQDEIMDPELYSELPRKEKEIPDELFERIYEDVFVKWYSKLRKERNYWDDQDLVREVLKNENLPSYPAIFCDEAQDFTRIELRLIMKLSAFSRYKLNQINSLPFVFAGDPMQTIHPTGFRWETTKRIFHEEIIESINSYTKPTLNFEPLNYNYRSTPAITKFSNTILMLRSAYSNNILSPQIPWRTESATEGTKPRRIIIDEIIKDTEHKNQLVKLLKEKIVIIPAEEDQIADYISNDPLLREVFPTISDDFPPKNIFTPTTAKGLEFDEIIICKFGEELPDTISKIMASKTKSEPLFEIEFFLNKLYVAVTRAKKQLFIVDTINGNEKLWKYLSDFNLLFAILSPNFNIDLWRDKIATIEEGDIKELTYSEFEKERIADELMQKGLDQRSPFLLYKAHVYYQELGKLEKANLCSAYALKFEEKFLDAAIQFEKINNLEKAKECLLKGKLWDETLKFFDRHPKLKDRDYQLVRFISNQNITPDLFKDFHAYIYKIKDEVNPQDELVKIAIEKYVKFLLEANPDSLDTTTWDESAQLLKAKFQHDHNSCRASARAFFISGNYKDACKLWEILKETEHKNYYIAKSKTTEPPENLNYLFKAGMYKEILDLWSEKGKPKTDPWLTYVIPYLKKINPDEIIFIYLETNPQKALSEFVEITKSKADDETLKLLNSILENINKLSISTVEKIKLYLNFLSMALSLPTAPEAAILENFIKFPGKLIINTDSKFDDDVEMSKEFEEFLNNFLKREKIELWEKYTNIQEIASILERTLSFKSTLKFYYTYIEKYALTSSNKFRDIIDAENPREFHEPISKIQGDEKLSYILRRIGKVILKQSEYHRNKGEKNIAENLREEVKKISKNFAISFNDFENEPEYPTANYEVYGFEKTKYFINVTEKDITFKTLIFEIKIKISDKLLLLVNEDTFETQRFEIEKMPNKNEYVHSYYKVELIKEDKLYINFYYKENNTWSNEGTLALKNI